MPRTRSFLKIGAIVLILLLPWCITTGKTAATQPTKRVRVGWYNSPFNETDSLGRRSGYAYDYQRLIAAHAGWTYEYVEGTWSGLLDMLQRGEIDLLSDITPSPERAKKMLFSKYDMGREDCYLIVKRDNARIQEGKPETLNGMRIAVNKNSLQMPLLQDWLAEHHIEAEIQECSLDAQEYLNKLESGQIDAWVTFYDEDHIDTHAFRLFSYLGSCDIHFAVNPQRPDLKEELDQAMTQIHAYSPNYSQKLHDDYFSKNSLLFSFSDKEREWIRQHDTIRIGFRDHYAPFCYTDDATGESQGLLREFANHVEAFDSTIHFRLVPYPSGYEAHQALLRGEIDVAFPSTKGALYDKKTHHFITEPLLTSGEIAIMRRSFNFEPSQPLRVAVNAGNPDYRQSLKTEFPHWKIVEFDTSEEGLKGISSGKADVMLVNNYRIPSLTRTLDHLDLKAFSTGNLISLSFTIHEENPTLFTLMNRLSRFMTDNEIHNALTRQFRGAFTPTFSDFVRTNTLPMFILFLLILAVFAFLFWRSQREHRRAESANMAKTRFLFNMSHDIRTPMNAIIGYTELLLQSKDSPEDYRRKSQNYLGKIHSSSKMLLGLINSVLEMSRIESGKSMLQEKACRPDKVVEDICSLYEERLRHKGLELRCTFSTRTKTVYADETKLGEIFLNLISNAYKYTPSGGRVTIEMEEQEISTPGYATFRTTVSDTGIGMEKDYLPQLFEEFTREKSVTESKITGTGLGMAIVKRLIDMMGGTISVSSTPGKGTTFTVTLTLRIAPEDALPETPDTASDMASTCHCHRILLAEDNDLNAEIATEILGIQNIEVDRAEDGRICVEKLCQAEDSYYDLILMDIQMPNMNGYEATKTIRALKDKAKANIPIVAMTANAFEEDKHMARLSGMDAHVPKPIDTRLLMSIITELTNRKHKG